MKLGVKVNTCINQLSLNKHYFDLVNSSFGDVNRTCQWSQIMDKQTPVQRGISIDVLIKIKNNFK